MLDQEVYVCHTGCPTLFSVSACVKLISCIIANTIEPLPVCLTIPHQTSILPQQASLALSIKC